MNLAIVHVFPTFAFFYYKYNVIYIYIYIYIYIIENCYLLVILSHRKNF